MTTILEARGVVKSFEGFRAVDGVDLQVEEGEVRAIIGPNGAGKSTFFYLITGHYRPTEGQVIFAGKDITGMSVPKVVQRGMVCTFQVNNVFARLSAMECVEAAVIGHRRRQLHFLRTIGSSTRTEAGQLLADLGLTHVRSQPAGALSHGDQRALEIAMALATEPRLLLLDEPTAGMSTTETRATVQMIDRLVKEHGLTVVLVEHDMDVVFSLADRVTVMHAGRVLTEGTSAEVQANPEVVEIYLGAPD